MGDKDMIGLAMIAAAARGPVLLARNDELQWRMFVRASLEAPAPAPHASVRVRQLEDTLRGVTDSRVRMSRVKGPTGL
jgi:hypothetical protein